MRSAGPVFRVAVLVLLATGHLCAQTSEPAWKTYTFAGQYCSIESPYPFDMKDVESKDGHFYVGTNLEADQSIIAFIAYTVLSGESPKTDPKEIPQKMIKVHGSGKGKTLLSSYSVPVRSSGYPGFLTTITYKDKDGELWRKTFIDVRVGNARWEALVASKRDKRELQPIADRIVGSFKVFPQDTQSAAFLKSQAVFQRDQDINRHTLQIKLHPKDPDAYISRGKNFTYKKQYRLAIDDFSKAIELDPGRAVVYNNRAVCYGSINDRDNALRDYDRSLKIELDPVILNNRGVLFAQMRKYEAALNDYGKAIELKPDYISPYFNRAKVYEALNKTDEAKKDYGWVVKLPVTTLIDLNHRGGARVVLGQYGQAVQDLTRSIGMDPFDASVYAARAKAYEALGETEKAKADLLKARELQ